MIRMLAECWSIYDHILMIGSYMINWCYHLVINYHPGYDSSNPPASRYDLDSSCFLEDCLLGSAGRGTWDAMVVFWWLMILDAFWWWLIMFGDLWWWLISCFVIFDDGWWFQSFANAGLAGETCPTRHSKWPIKVLFLAEPTVTSRLSCNLSSLRSSLGPISSCDNVTLTLRAPKTLALILS